MIPWLASQTQPLPRPTASPLLLTTKKVDGSALAMMSALEGAEEPPLEKTPRAAIAPTATAMTIATMPTIVARLTARWSITRWIADCVREGRATGWGWGAWKTGCAGGGAGAAAVAPLAPVIATKTVSPICTCSLPDSTADWIGWPFTNVPLDDPRS